MAWQRKAMQSKAGQRTAWQSKATHRSARRFFKSFHGTRHMTPEKYPFDFDALKKGDIIPAEKLEEITKASRTHANYSLKILALKEQIEKELEARGRPVNVKCEKGSLKILTDEESIPYSAQLFKQHRVGLARAHIRTCIIDVRNIGEDAKKRLESQLLNQAAKLAAMRRASSKKLSATDGGGQLSIE